MIPSISRDKEMIFPKPLWHFSYKSCTISLLCNKVIQYIFLVIPVKNDTIHISYFPSLI